MTTTTEDIVLAFDLIQASGFKWMCGMKTACGVRLKDGWQLKKWIKSFHIDDSPVPDINDPATRGCLLELARKASRDQECYVCIFDEGWAVVEWPESANSQSYHRSEGAALAEYIIYKS